MLTESQIRTAARAELDKALREMRDDPIPGCPMPSEEEITTACREIENNPVVLMAYYSAANSSGYRVQVNVWTGVQTDNGNGVHVIGEWACHSQVYNLPRYGAEKLTKWAARKHVRKDLPVVVRRQGL